MMPRRGWRVLAYVVLPAAICGSLAAQTRALTWNEIRERFRANNPNLMAAGTGIQESRANEVTAGLRPNPTLSFVADEFRVIHPNPLQPFQNSQITPVLAQLFERHNKRQLRVDSARLATRIASTDEADLERTLTFNLRDAFNRTLQANALLGLAQDNLAYYDQILKVNQERFKAGDIAKVDLERLELQRVQFETDIENARVNLRTSKIQLLALMNDKTPLDSFDVTGPFEYKETILLPQELHQIAMDSRPDLQSATTAIDKARSDNKLAWANGSTDPTIGLEYQRTQPDNTFGLSLGIPLRIFDRNQGEKARTALEIRRTGQLREALVASILRDVDSAYAQVESVRSLLRPYQQKYLAASADVRDTVKFAYGRGGASLLDFLDAQKSYRDTQLNYLNLIGSYLSAVNQLNLAVGREVMQ
jgi:cobalt-zinc-cadmium efflux system outer membrane protein